MIYVAVIVAICLAELLIRRYINQNVEEDGQKWGKCGVRLRKYHNYGMANDTLRKRPMLVKIIGVVVVSFLAVVFLFLLTLKGEKAGKWGLALILGGGLANLLERFVHGYVTDYLQFRVPLACLRKLIYNVADLCIFAGTAVLFFRELAEAVSGPLPQRCHSDAEIPERAGPIPVPKTCPGKTAGRIYLWYRSALHFYK